MKHIISFYFALFSFASSFSQGFELNDSTSYFPPKAYERINWFGKVEIDSMTLTYHSLYLSKFEEPILYRTETKDEIFRFTWLRSFDKPMIFKLVIKESNQATLEIKEGNQMQLATVTDLRKLRPNEIQKYNKYCKGELDYIQVENILKKVKITKPNYDFQYQSEKMKFSQVSLNEFRELFKRSNFSSLRSMESNLYGSDGAHWILEHLNSRFNYEFVYRWSPENNNFKDLCLYLISFGSLSKKEIY